jgi:hypothetical protein
MVDEHGSARWIGDDVETDRVSSSGAGLRVISTCKTGVAQFVAVAVE